MVRFSFLVCKCQHVKKKNRSEPQIIEIPAYRNSAVGTRVDFQHAIWYVLEVLRVEKQWRDSPMMRRVIDLLMGSAAISSPAERRDDSYDTLLAVCALFVEIAAIDGKLTQVERDRIVSILKSEYGLSNQDASELMRVSREQLKQSLDYWQFTNLINQNYTMDEKVRIIELLWKIVYTDGKLEQHEDYLMKKLSSLLEIPHSEFIAAKLRVKKK
jgi:uncharacterized tellurite resistance protein B-like protein